MGGDVDIKSIFQKCQPVHNIYIYSLRLYASHSANNLMISERAQQANMHYDQMQGYLHPEPTVTHRPTRIRKNLKPSQRTCYQELTTFFPHEFGDLD